MPTMKYLLVSLGTLLAGPSAIVSQDIGKDICACSPSVYEFTLDFGLSCPPVNVEENDAVDRTSCAITPFGDPAVTDLVPVAVQSIDILELGQGLRILVQERIAGNFTNGSTFNYTSLSANASDIVDLTDVPRAIQVNIVGTNKQGESLLNVYIITFSNNCDAYPVFVEGQSAGWTSFVSIFVVLHYFAGERNSYPISAESLGSSYSRFLSLWLYNIAYRLPDRLPDKCSFDECHRFANDVSY